MVGDGDGLMKLGHQGWIVGWSGALAPEARDSAAQKEQRQETANCEGLEGTGRAEVQGGTGCREDSVERGLSLHVVLLSRSSWSISIGGLSFI